MPEFREVELINIHTDGGTQPRAQIDLQLVAEYAAIYREEAGKLPPLTVFFDGSEYWLADGFHRYFAAGDALIGKLMCEVKEGSQRDAVLYSCGTNHDHGLRRTTEDKRKAVTTLLMDDTWGKRSDRWIAEACHVSHSFVGSVRTMTPSHAELNGESIGLELIDEEEDTEPEPERAQVTSNPETNGMREGQDGIRRRAKKRVLDGAGSPITSKTSSIANSPFFSDTAKKLEALAKEIKKVGGTKAGRYLMLDQITGNLMAARNAILNGKFHAACPACNGDGCSECRQSGWMPKWRLEEFRHHEPTAT